MKHSLPAVLLTAALGCGYSPWIKAQDVPAPWFQSFADSVRARLQQLEELVTQNSMDIARQEDAVASLETRVSQNSSDIARHEEALGLPLDAAWLELGHARQGQNTVRAFVETGSLSHNCLVTLSESNWAVPGISVFCAPRAFQGRSGLLVSVFFLFPPPSNLILSAAVYQQGAQRYPTPVLYPN